MTLANGRAGVRILVIAGTGGVCAEYAWIRYGILSGLMGSASWDLALAEIAVTVVFYGMLFGLAAAVTWYPALMIAPIRRRPETPRRRWIRSHSAAIWMILIVLLSVTFVLQQLYLFAIGLFSSRYAVSSLLHLYPILALYVAAFTFDREARAANPSPMGDDELAVRSP